MVRERIRGNNAHECVHTYRNAQKGNEVFAMHLSHVSTIYLQLLVLLAMAFAAFMILLPGA